MDLWKHIQELLTHRNTSACSILEIHISRAEANRTMVLESDREEKFLAALSAVDEVNRADVVVLAMRRTVQMHEISCV